MLWPKLSKTKKPKEKKIYRRKVLLAHMANIVAVERLSGDAADQGSHLLKVKIVFFFSKKTHELQQHIESKKCISKARKKFDRLIYPILRYQRYAFSNIKGWQTIFVVLESWEVSGWGTYGKTTAVSYKNPTQTRSVFETLTRWLYTRGFWRTLWYVFKRTSHVSDLVLGQKHPRKKYYERRKKTVKNGRRLQAQRSSYGCSTNPQHGDERTANRQFCSCIGISQFQLGFTHALGIHVNVLMVAAYLKPAFENKDDVCLLWCLMCRRYSKRSRIFISEISSS